MQTKEFYEDLFGGDAPGDMVLTSVFEIENILSMLREIEDKVKFYKDLKKFRAQSIDVEIDHLSDKSQRLRKAVLATMKSLEPKKKTLTFPSVGKVSRRKGKDKWNVSDEQAMLAFFDSEGVKDQVIRTVEKVDGKEVGKVLENFADQDMAVPGATKKPAEEILSITYDKDESADEVSTKPRIPEKTLTETDV